MLKHLTRFTRGSTKVAACITIATAGLAASSVRATIITFDNGSVVAGNVLSNQYASQGVTFAAGGGSTTGVIAPSADSGIFATNTDLTIGSLPTSSGAGAPLSGLTLRTSNGWLAENGNPAFTMTFSSAVTFLSLDFGANASTQPSIFAVNPTTGVAIAVGSSLSTVANGTVTAANIPTGTTKFVVLPGNYNDFVTVDNINFTAVPEPSTLAASALGASLLGVWLRRRRTVA